MEYRNILILFGVMNIIFTFGCFCILAIFPKDYEYDYCFCNYPDTLAEIIVFILGIILISIGIILHKIKIKKEDNHAIR